MAQEPPAPPVASIPPAPPAPSTSAAPASLAAPAPPAPRAVSAWRSASAPSAPSVPFSVSAPLASLGAAAASGPPAAATSDTSSAEPGADERAGRSAETRTDIRRGRIAAALRERLPLWAQAHCAMERRSVLALSVVLLAAAVLAAQHFWGGRPQPVRAPETVRAAAPYPAVADSTASVTGAAGVPATAPAATAAEIVVDVSGKVREPGIHRLPAGSRVADALRAAGGVRPGTDTGGINRARFLVDGEQVVVGAPLPASAAAAGTAGAAAGVPPPGAGPTAPLSLNTATLEQLDTLPGVGPVLARHILDHRTRHGGFRSVDELRQVNGIGERRFADLRNLVRP
ncbi:helix-hairpin-helix domain-containing protein [Streptomyces sp. bgisy159]|uniref:helix-hairpin-helix domain-containing protein n=1 Tax=Streptomyces sp. bgisy159 TaxID=3413795 RepID=UPI003F4A5A85